MKVWISDNDSNEVVCLNVDITADHKIDVQCLEGDLPDGLVLSDLGNLAIVTYESGARGRPIPKIKAIEPCENLEYLRALIEAMPPGFYVSRVESEAIDRLREQKIEKFEQELESLNEEG